MKLHYFEIRVFAKPEDDLEKVKQGLLSFFSFDLDKEKVKLNKKNALGFNEKKIVIFHVKVKKQTLIALFLNKLNEILSDEQKYFIKSQAESRLDNDTHIYLRFDKSKLIDEKKFWLTDKGDCYHIKLAIASFPKSRENALKCLRSLF